MHYRELAQRVDFFKHEPKGVKAVCNIIQELIAEERIDWRNEGIDEANTRMAREMLRDNKPIEEIIKYSHLPLERIEALAQQIR